MVTIYDMRAPGQGASQASAGVLSPYIEAKPGSPLLALGVRSLGMWDTFMDTLRELSPAMLVRFTQIDYDREMALAALIEVDGLERIIGVARYAANPDGNSVEFALAVADEWQKHGIGPKLMSALMECAKAKGYQTIVGDVLVANDKMLKLMTNLGFTIHPHHEDNAVKRVVRPLQD